MLKITQIDNPQVAESLTWQAKARETFRKRLTSEVIGKYADAVIERALAGDRTACKQMDAWLGVGVPVTLESTSVEVDLEATLESQVEELVLAAGELPLGVLASRLQISQLEARSAVNRCLGNQRIRLLPGDRVAAA